MKNGNCPTVWMQEALSEAKRAFTEDEVPIGAIVVFNNEKVIGRGHNAVEKCNDPTAHAEIIALREAAKNIGSWRLNNCDIYTTVEPCPMCCAAMSFGRINKCYYGAKDKRMGACGSIFDLSNYSGMPSSFSSYGGILKEESEKLLKNFFKERRFSG